jgi:hypothetical protein
VLEQIGADIYEYPGNRLNRLNQKVRDKLRTKQDDKVR